MLFLLLVKNYQELGNTFRTKNGATVAISKMVGKGTIKRTEFEPLQKALIALRQYTQTTDPCASTNTSSTSSSSSSSSSGTTGSGSGEGGSSFPKNVDETVSNILNLIEYSVKIDLYRYDQEMLQDLYYKISLSFVHTPDLRLAWLDNLANHHVKNENLEEAAQCKMHIASLIAQYLEKQRVFLKKIPPDFALFPFVSPFLKEEHTHWEPPAQLESQNWTVKKLIQVLREAIELFDKATCYELCMEVYMLLDQIHKAQRQRKYEDIIANLEEYKELCDRLVDTNNPPDRLYPVYYRVGFYGTLWEDLNQKEFIYKMSTKFNLSAFKKHLLDQYTKKFGNKVEVLTSNEDINFEKLDPKKCYIQIAPVSPHFTHEEAEERGTRFEQNFNVST
jgi:transposase